MNKIKYICVISLYVLATACSKTMDLDKLSFNAEKSEVQVVAGEELSFDLEGFANIITFFSGEVGNEYKYREGRPLELSLPQVSFTSDAFYGTQPGQLSVLVSTKFNGVYTPESIKASFDAEEWIDLTNEFDIRENTGVRHIPSGVFDLSEIITPEKKDLYFAFRNKVQPDAIAGPVTQWTMSRFSLTVGTILGRQTLVDHQSAGWSIIVAQDIDNKDPLVQASSVFFRRNDNRNLYLDNWAITKRISFDAIDLGPDLGIPIKSYADPQMTSFTYTYEVPGTYLATFIASNVNAKEEVKVIKQVKVVVTEPF